jgi:prepilin-type N-terminal cleavage/methylation domain-containing protein
MLSTPQSGDATGVKGRGPRRRFEKIRKHVQQWEAGFTLLELLVVVAILAAIAGTATIMLQDTDRKGAAAAHVAMMDELSKGIQTFRVLNEGAYPDVWDSLLSSKATDANVAKALEEANIGDVSLLEILSPNLKTNLKIDALGEDALSAFNSVGIRRVRVVNGVADNDPDDNASPATCENKDGDSAIRALVTSKSNDITPQTIFRSKKELAPDMGRGCGYENHTDLTADSKVALWTGEGARVGIPLTQADAGVYTGPNPGGYRLVAFGIGSDSTLFNPSILGALSNVPVYRNNASDEYNRFIVLWNLNPVVEILADHDDNPVTPDTWVSRRVGNGEAIFQAIIDPAGDTKDEELGEVDNVRSTL